MVQNAIWKTILKALENAPNPHGYSVLQLLQVLEKDFSLIVTEKTLRKTLRQILDAPVSVTITYRRTGKSRFPIAFFSLKINFPQPPPPNV